MKKLKYQHPCFQPVLAENQLLLEQIKAIAGSNACIDPDLPPQTVNNFLKAVLQPDSGLLFVPEVTVTEKIGSGKFPCSAKLTNRRLAYYSYKVTNVLYQNDIMVKSSVRVKERPFYDFILQHVLPAVLKNDHHPGYPRDFFYEDYVAEGAEGFKEYQPEGFRDEPVVVTEPTPDNGERTPATSPG